MRSGNRKGWNEAHMNTRIITGWLPCMTGLLLCVLSAAGRAAENNLPPAYVPQRQVTGRIVIWGHGSFGNTTDFIESLTRSWEAGFGKVQPGVTFENRLYGTASAIGALYTRTGD